MSAISRARPQPLATKLFVPTRTKYQFVRMKEMLHNALGGSRGAGLFSTGILPDPGSRGSVSVGTADAGAAVNMFGSPLDSAGLESAGGLDSRRSSFAQRAVLDGARHFFPTQLGAPSRKSSTSGISTTGHI